MTFSGAAPELVSEARPADGGVFAGGGGVPVSLVDVDDDGVDGAVVVDSLVLVVVVLVGLGLEDVLDDVLDVGEAVVLAEELVEPAVGEDVLVVPVEDLPCLPCGCVVDEDAAVGAPVVEAGPAEVPVLLVAGAGPPPWPPPPASGGGWGGGSWLEEMRGGSTWTDTLATEDSLPSKTVSVARKRGTRRFSTWSSCLDSGSPNMRGDVRSRSRTPRSMSSG